MIAISMTAEAGLDICRRIASGELEVFGIQVRETGSKKIRYVLRGFENLPTDPTVLDGVPPLAPLRQAIGITQLLGVVAVAQNAAVALSLKRIERSIERIEHRLGEIEERLARIETKVDIVIDRMRRSPVFRLKAAHRAATGAHVDSDQSALRTAASHADEAAHDILDQAAQLVRVEHDGLPYALWTANELGDLIGSGTEAVRIASGLYLALGNRKHAIEILSDAAGAIERMRRRLHVVLTDPELMLRRVANDPGGDAQIIKAGEALREALHVCRGREMMIRLDLIARDSERREFEKAEPVQDFGFVEIRRDTEPSAARAS